MNAIPVAIFERHNTCLNCGYDLFGQPRAGVCPECGTSTRESARHETFLAQPGNLARLRSGTALLLWSAILSGLCPAVCILCMACDGHILVVLLMTAIFAATALTAAFGERALESMRDFAPAELAKGPAPRVKRVPDVVAGVGLLLVNAAAYVYSLGNRLLSASGSEFQTPIMTFIGVGFFLLCITAWRATPAYALRADIADACLGTRRRGFRGLGIAKTIFETVWLGCCWLPMFLLLVKAEDIATFLAFAALLGLGGYAVIWLLMIIFHAILFVQVRRAFSNEVGRGFEVGGPTQPTSLSS